MLELIGLISVGESILPPTIEPRIRGGMGAPDYRNMVIFGTISNSSSIGFFPTEITSSTAKGTEYTAPDDGWIFVILSLSSEAASQNYTGSLTVEVMSLEQATTDITSYYMMPAAKGDVFSFYMQGSSGAIDYKSAAAVFVPSKKS